MLLEDFLDSFTLVCGGGGDVRATTPVTSSQDDDNYAANLVAEFKRRSKKEVQQSYWHMEDREVGGEIDDEMEDNSTLTGGTLYQKENVLGLLENACTGDLCLGAVEDEISNQITKKQWVQRKKNRRKSSRRGEARDAQEDATLEGGTVLSGYTREDATLADTLLSGSTRGGTTFLSGYTREDATMTGTTTLLSGSIRGGTIISGSYSTEYEMPVTEKHLLFSEPNFLAEDDGEEGENELVSDKAFAVIQNVCSSSWLQNGKVYQLFSKQSFQSKGEGTTVSTRSKQQSVEQGWEETVAKYVKESEDLNRSRNKVMTGISMIRKPPQDELKAIYESISSAEGKKPSLTKEPIEIQASTVNSAARKKGKLTKEAPALTTKQKKSFRPRLFSFTRKKCHANTPVSSAPTEATSNSDTSVESQSLDDDDAELAITRTESRILISI